MEMEESMPTSGIWFVKHKPGVSSYSSIIKLAEIPKKWPILHYIEYKDEILSALVKYIDTVPNKSVSLDQIVNFTLEQVSTQYVIDRDKEFPDKKINNIKDLTEHLNS